MTERLAGCIGPSTVARLDAVTWVGADRRRAASRGVHLPEQVARGIARSLEIPAVCMVVRRHHRAQRGLDRSGRQRNVSGAFVLVPDLRVGTPRGAQILLIDDVRTTGATLAECQRVLAGAGYVVHGLAVIGVERAGQGRATLADSSPPGEDFLLRKMALAADDHLHYERERASRLTAPRPP